MATHRTAWNTVVAFVALAILSAVAVGCGSGSSSEGSNTPTSQIKAQKENSPKTKKGQKDKGSDNSQKKATKRVKTPGRSPGVKASEPRYVDLYAARVSAGRAASLKAPPGTAGKWTLVLLRGSYNFSPGATFVGGTLRVSGDRMTFRQRGGCKIPTPAKPPRRSHGKPGKGGRSKDTQGDKRHRKRRSAAPAPSRKLGPAGVYRWALNGRTLTFKPVKDACANRRAQLPGVKWTLQL